MPALMYRKFNLWYLYSCQSDKYNGEFFDTDIKFKLAVVSTYRWNWIASELNIRVSKKRRRSKEKVVTRFYHGRFLPVSRAANASLLIYRYIARKSGERVKAETERGQEIRQDSGLFRRLSSKCVGSGLLAISSVRTDRYARSGNGTRSTSQTRSHSPVVLPCIHPLLLGPWHRSNWSLFP